MSKEKFIAIALEAISSFMPDVKSFFVNAFDKVGFDLDTIGRKRHAQLIEEKMRSTFEGYHYNVNIAVWNMHLNEDHDFEHILVTGLVPMGNGGGFRVVVFQGGGWLRNNGDRGYENWRCSGNLSQNNNVITFYPIK